MFLRSLKSAKSRKFSKFQKMGNNPVGKKVNTFKSKYLGIYLFTKMPRLFFYRAMHFSAKSGLAIACRLFVRLSVTLVDCDHIGWNSSKIISRLVSVGVRSLQTQTSWLYSKGRSNRVFGAQSDLPLPVDLSVGDIRSQTAAEAQRSQWRAYRKPPSLFRMVPSLTPCHLPSPKIREWPYLRNNSFDQFI